MAYAVKVPIPVRIYNNIHFRKKYRSSKYVLQSKQCYAICKHNWEQLKIHVKSMANNYATTQCHSVLVLYELFYCVINVYTRTT